MRFIHQIGLASVLALMLGAVAPVAAAGPTLHSGKFLVANREMLDPNFAESVVLLIEHGTDGARGLVVNRPSKLKLSALSSEIEGLRHRQDPIYVGGPIPGGPIFVLIRSGRPLGDAKPVLENVFLSRDRSILQRLTEKRGTEFRVYAGYAGWAPGQLENELSRGDWHILPAGPEWIFSQRPGEIWNRLIPPEPSRQARTLTPDYRPSRYGSGAKLESSNPRDRSRRVSGSPGSGQ